MKVAFLINDELLTHRFSDQQIKQGDDLLFFDQPDNLLACLSKQSFEVIVLSDRFFNFSSLCDYIERIKEEHQALKIILLLSNKHNVKSNEQYIKYCLSNQISYVHPGQSASQITEKVNQQIFGEEMTKHTDDKNVVLFLGSTPNIGTTVTSFCTAMQIAKQTKKQIAYICLNLKSSKIHRYLGIEQPLASLDSIRAEIKSQGLNKENLKNYCFTLKEISNLHVLFGNMMREQAEFYTVEDIHYLLDVCSSTFDLCIVEVNAYWDNAATICGLLYDGIKIVVSTNQLGHFQEDMNRWLKSVSSVFDIKISNFDLFLSQWVHSSPNHGFPLKDIRKETELNIVGKMRKWEQIDEHLNQGRIVDLALNDSLISRDLSGLVNMLITLYSLEKKHSSSKKKWMQRWLGGQG